ncbi:MULTISPECIES: DUF2624 domain-containing protein [unclassified Virgibacillus]|uniref:DUF2624 domain-containing protein n=1 Tax=unclassified Virgibacillus TaxID=2620237 RepID=UPI0024DE7BD6|nr:DUF2624 domain-containing protein [Virgibacillus sp. LDC-1]
MNDFIKELALKKIKQTSPREIQQYAREYGFSITRSQAEQISTYIRTQKIDPFHESGRKKMLKDLALITDEETAMKANQLFKELIKTYGLEGFFA